MNKQGQFLTEVTFEFRAKIDIEVCKVLLNELIEVLEVQETHRHINILPPGFDILCGLKESCIYFGCWPEHNYNRLIVSSCKKFNYNLITILLEKHLQINDKIYITINSDEPIKEKVASLWI